MGRHLKKPSKKKKTAVAASAAAAQNKKTKTYAKPTKRQHQKHQHQQQNKKKGPWSSIDSVFGPIRRNRGPSHFESQPVAQMPALPAEMVTRASGKKSSSHKKKKEKSSKEDKKKVAKKQQLPSKHTPPQQSSSMKKKKKSKQKQFQIRAPKNTTTAPWLRHDKATSTAVAAAAESPSRKNKKGSSSSSPSCILSLMQTIPASALQQLDQEIYQFASYVQLSTDECQARNYVIDSIQEMVEDVVGTNHADSTTQAAWRRNGGGVASRKDEEDNDGVHCQVFGSFASRPVCTFQSDVDLAVWGVVRPTDKKNDFNAEGRKGKHTRFSNRKEPPPTAEMTEETASAGTTTQGVAEHPNRKKQERVVKWKQALLENAEVSTTTTSSKEPSKSPAALKNDQPLANEEKKEEDEDFSFLFVIDRIGDEVIDVDKNGETTAQQLAGQTIDNPIVLGGANGDDKKNNNAVEEAAVSSAREENPLVIDIQDDDSDANSDIKKDDDDDDDDDRYRDASDASDEDTADKLEGLKSKATRRRADYKADADDNSGKNEEAGRAPTGLSLLALPDAEETTLGASHLAQYSDDDSDGDSDDEEESVRRRRSVVSLSSSTTSQSDDERSWDDSGMEVSFVSPPPPTFPSGQGGKVRYYDEENHNLPAPPTFGPEGQTRVMVLSALNSIAKKMRKFFSGKVPLTVRRHARVPIINMETPFGYECDVALGGHNGTDTSLYAAKQCERFQSFSVVVLVLKILLSQQDLDKPFTGGLGSYKLYVLVAHHLDRHLSLGGSDRPGEVLLSFLFRYCGYNHRHQNIHASAQTRMSRTMVIECSDDEDTASPGSMVEMGGVYQIDSCAQLFHDCWSRLYNSLCVNREKNKKQKGSPKTERRGDYSYLGHVIDGHRLEKERGDCIRKAKSWTKHYNMRKGYSPSSAFFASSSQIQNNPPPRKKQKKRYS